MNIGEIAGSAKKRPFKNFTVSITDNPNEFIVRVTNLSNSLAMIEISKPLEIYRCSLERALFIEQAIEEKLK